MDNKNREALAIIGIGCRYPGNITTPEEFWSLIINKKDALGPIPENRWDTAAFYDPDWKRTGKINTDRGGFVADIDKFDANFFGISPLEASRMDPQQRMLLEVSYELIEDAGLNLTTLHGSNTAVFIGISAHDYSDIQNTPQERMNISAHTNIGSAQSIAANRISYSYNLTGPSLALDTACSSSLNAIHMACRAIWEGDADAAFAGGVNAILKPEPHIGFSMGGFLSPDGTCYSFDERGNGYVRSEGVGLIFIKPLSQAEQDGDNIYAVILGSAINQDGATKGISVPNPKAQESLLHHAYKDAGINPKTVGYIEAHGTGTFVGDPIESNAIGNVIGKERDDTCYIGSIKANIGHLEPASGIAGLSKLALSLHHKTIPPNIHFSKPNPNIAFDELKLKVPTEAMAWPENQGLRVGGVNSFGFGGSNAHIVLQEYPQDPLQLNDKSGLQVATLSAKNHTTLQKLAQDYVHFLTDSKNTNTLSDICNFTATRRSHHEHRLAIIADSKQALNENLQLYLKGESLTEISTGKLAKNKNNIVFIFSGQGPQWWAMGRQLIENEEVFRYWIKKIDHLLAEHANWSLIEELNKTEKDSRIIDTQIAQPAIFAIQVALYEMWKFFGVQPKAVVGHSIGEVAAAYVSGALTLKQAVRLIYHRSRIQFKASNKGGMLAVGVDKETAEKLIIGKEDKVSIAAVNGPEMVALSGDNDALALIEKHLKDQEVFHQRLKVNVPFHSHHMEPLKDELLSSLGEFHSKETNIPFYSTVTGKIISGKELTASYWFKNVREPVYFTDAITAPLDDGFDIFIELGPHPIHASGIEALMLKKKTKGLVVPSLRRNENEKRTFLASVAKLHCRGVKIDWKNFYGPDNSWVNLPRYPWQHESYWIETDEGKNQRLGHRCHHHPHLIKETVSARESNNIIWQVDLDSRIYPYIQEHKVQGPIIYPGAGHLDLIIGAAKASFPDTLAFIEDINFEHALFLPDSGEPPHIQIDISHDSGDYFIYSKAKKTNSQWIMCSNGKINHLGDHFDSISIDIEQIKTQITTPVDVKALHQELLASGLYLGPSFRSITALWKSKKSWESFGEIQVEKSIQAECFQFNIHPAVLDSCFQTMFGIFNQGNSSHKKMGIYIPRHIDKIKWHNDMNSYQLQVYANLREWTDEFALGELWIFNQDGSLIAEFHGFKSQYLKGSRGEQADEQEKWFYHYQWQMKLRAEQKLQRNPSELLCSLADINEGVQETISDIQSSAEQTDYYMHYEPEQNKITTAYICDALNTMGVSLEVGSKLNVASLIKELNIIDIHHRWFRHLFKLLEATDIVTKRGDDFIIKQQTCFNNLTTTINDLTVKFPQFDHESILLARCGPNIQAVLQGKVDPIQLIFPEDKWDAIVEYYAKSFAFKKYNDIAKRCLSELLKKITADQTIRILEIGAGTGGMTQAILPILPADRTEYVFSDLSHMFIDKAQQRFAQYPFMEYQIIDIEQDPAKQDLDLHSYDIIIASDVIHATKNINTSLNHVQKLLASEGVLIMLEVTNCPVYLDLIFGMTEGWWLYNDLDIRAEHAILPKEKWQSLLQANHFSTISCYSDVPNNQFSCQNVILAQSEKRSFNIIDKENHQKTSAKQWLVFADETGVATAVTDHLTLLNKSCLSIVKGEQYQQVTETVISINPFSPEETNQVIERAINNNNLEGIIFAWGLDLPSNQALTIDTIETSESYGSMMLMNIMRKLNTLQFNTSPNIWVLLSGSQTVAETPIQLNLSQEGLRGVGRCVINEFPNFKTTLVDLSCPVQDNEIATFIDELFCNEKVDELALRGTKRYINKLERISTHAILENAQQTVQAYDNAYSCTLAETGILDSMQLCQTTTKLPEKDEVQVTIKASALNFRDIMTAMGLLSKQAIEGGLFGDTFGLECAGVITAIGDEVTDFKLGDEVMAIAPACLGGFSYPKAAHCLLKPQSINWQEAASLPVVYLTAYFSLIHLCRLEQDESILIHAAAGGVGIAAINIATAIGAEIYATVSTPDKHDYLISLGVKPENIMNSRSLSFAQEIMEKTHGKGVDVVLNSLSGQAIFKSISCLAPSGRFVEIGKTDIYRNSKLALQPFGNNLSYFGVDIDRLLRQKVNLTKKLFNKAIAYFIENNFKPHPINVYPMAKLNQALHVMASSKYIGKIIVSMEGNVNICPAKQIQFNHNNSYLITGGASGFGLAIAQWMTTKGCRNLILLSRSGPKTPEETTIINNMRNQGINIMLALGSVDCPKDMDRIFKQIESDMPPLKGIQHAAMVLDDGSIPEMTPKRYMKVFKPKAIGCWILHQQTKSLDLEHFICYSSISSVFGNPGQVNYAAANNFLDNFAYWRRSQGLAATTINWGVIGEVGFVARDNQQSGNINELLDKQGWKAFSLQQASDILENTLLTNPTQRIAIDTDWATVGKFFPHSTESSRFEHLIKQTSLSLESGMKISEANLKSSLLKESNHSEATKLLQQALKKTFARVLGASTDKLDITEPVTQYGLDSLMANQIRNWVQSNISIDYSMMQIMKGPSIAEMTEELLNELTGEQQKKSVKIEKKATNKLDKWLIRKNKVDNPRLRLYCFPYFSGGASVFNTWHEYLPKDIEVCAIQFPGREERADEIPYEDIVELVTELASVIEPLLHTPFAFYAHSAGGRIAFELCRHLTKTMLVHPEHFLIGGWLAPHLESSLHLPRTLTDSDIYKTEYIPMIKEHLRTLDIPDQVIDNEKVFNEMLPSLRADIILSKNYTYKDQPPLTCPITAFSGSHDKLFTEQQIQAWQRHTSNRFDYKKISGGHLFCRDNKIELLEVITKKIS